MRRKDREMPERADQLAVLERCKVCHLGMIAEGKPYIVPMNYGYEVEEDAVCVYFHSALEGKKIDALKAGGIVCFEVDTDHQLVEDALPCKNGFLYSSVIGEGEVEFIEDPEEKKAALNCVMRHQTGKTFEFSDNAIRFVAVCRLRAETLTGKRRAH